MQVLAVFIMMILWQSNRIKAQGKDNMLVQYNLPKYNVCCFDDCILYFSGNLTVGDLRVNGEGEVSVEIVTEDFYVSYTLKLDSIIGLTSMHAQRLLGLCSLMY